MAVSNYTAQIPARWSPHDDQANHTQGLQLLVKRDVMPLTAGKTETMREVNVEPCAREFTSAPAGFPDHFGFVCDGKKCNSEQPAKQNVGVQPLHGTGRHLTSIITENKGVFSGEQWGAAILQRPVLNVLQ